MHRRFNSEKMTDSLPQSAVHTFLRVLCPSNKQRTAGLLILVFLLFALPGITTAASWYPITEQYVQDWDNYGWPNAATVIYGGSVSNDGGVYQATMSSKISALDPALLNDNGGWVIWGYSTVLQLGGLEPSQSARVTVSVKLTGSLFGELSGYDEESWLGSAYDITAATSGGSLIQFIEQEDLRVVVTPSHDDKITEQINLGGTLIYDEIMMNGDQVMISGTKSTWANAYCNSSGPDFFAKAEADAVFSYTVSVNVIPIPAAIWLLGSGIIGLVGVRRKFIKH
jgi:hypothetical protein